MSQNDFNIANQGFPATRADINSALQALASTSSGAAAPSTTYAYQLWYDTSTNLLKMRNADNDGFITLAAFDQAADEWELRTAVVQAVDSAGVVIKTDDGTTRVTIAASGNVTLANDLAVTGTVQSSNISATGSMASRNKIINGAMTIDQRNAGAAITTSGFLVDRWNVTNANDGAFSAQQDANAPVGFTKSIKWTTTTADASLTGSQYAIVRQGVEGYNIADLGWGTANAKPITISFWVRSSLTGTFGAAMHNADFNRSFAFTYSISSADTWEYKSVTIAGDTTGTWNTTNSVGIQLYFGLGVGPDLSLAAGSWSAGGYLSATGAVSVVGTLNATWYITGVQLEAGDTATPFEHRSYGQELGLCQRYFQVLGGVTNGFPLLQAYGATSDFVAVPISFHETMRATPTLAKVGTWAATNCGQPIFLYASPYGCSMGVSVTSTGLAQSHPNSTDDIATASAEL